MSVQETWGEALDVLWGHLGSGDTVLSQVMRYGLVLLLLAGAAWQVKSGHDMMVELEDPVPLFAPPVNTIGEQGRVEELLRVFDGLGVGEQQPFFEKFRQGSLPAVILSRGQMVEQDEKFHHVRSDFLLAEQLEIAEQKQDRVAPQPIAAGDEVRRQLDVQIIA